MALYVHFTFHRGVCLELQVLISCHFSTACTGGLKGIFGLAEDPSPFSLVCRQVGLITLPAQLPKDEVVFSEDTSLLFKETSIHRSFDAKRHVLL